MQENIICICKLGGIESKTAIRKCFRWEKKKSDLWTSISQPKLENRCPSDVSAPRTQNALIIQREYTARYRWNID